MGWGASLRVAGCKSWVRSSDCSGFGGDSQPAFSDDLRRQSMRASSEAMAVIDAALGHRDAWTEERYIDLAIFTVL